MNELAPICLFTYNRIEETIQTVSALKKNYLAKESDLIIFSDGHKDESTKKKVTEIRNYLKTVTGFKTVKIKESEINKGLANSIIHGVSEVIYKYGKTIVLEDDLITTPNFLNFMNQALDFYKDDDTIQSINGFSLKINNPENIYFHKRTFPWGWATWKNVWSQRLFDKDYIQNKITDNPKLLKKFNKICGNDMASMLQDSMSGVNSSWYVRWVFNHFSNNKYSVYPTLSKVVNIGFMYESTHCNGINTYISELDNKFNMSFTFVKLKELDKDMNKEFLRYFKKSYKLFFRIGLLKNLYGRKLLINEIKRKFF